MDVFTVEVDNRQCFLAPVNQIEIDPPTVKANRAVRIWRKDWSLLARVEWQLIEAIHIFRSKGGQGEWKVYIRLRPCA